MLKSDVNRREFLKITAGAGAALAVPLPHILRIFQNDRHPSRSRFVCG